MMNDPKLVLESEMEEEMTVPGDPERMRFHENPRLKEIQKYIHYARMTIGSVTLGHLTRLGLMVVPEEMFLDLLEQVDKEAFDIMASFPNRAESQGDK